MRTKRLEGLTDATVAIIATIMVLEIKAPEVENFMGLFEQWPEFLAHFNSFFVVYILWYNNDRILCKTEDVSVDIVILQGIWLFLLSFIPFSSDWVGTNPDEFLPQFIYIALILACTLTYQLIFHVMTVQHPELVSYEHSLTIKRYPVYIGLVIALIFTFFYPVMSQLITFIVIIYMTVNVLLMKKKKTS